MNNRLQRTLTGLILAAFLLAACSEPARPSRGRAATPLSTPPQAAAPVEETAARPAPVTLPVTTATTENDSVAVIPPHPTGALTARPEYTAGSAARNANVSTTARRDPATMTMDLVLARPAGAVATLAGAAIFLVSWPFSALGGNSDEAWDSLVVTPASYTFQRPLGDFDYKRPQETPVAP